MGNILHIGIIATLFAITAPIQPASAQEHKEEAYGYVHESPNYASDPWVLASGGRIYDKWWEALDRDEPEETNPVYPANGQKSGSTTWRCKECHGWDYRGKDGVYSSGSHFTGITGIRGAQGQPEDYIMRTLRDANHPYTKDMITDNELRRISAFVSRGQIDMTTFMDASTRTMTGGDPNRGREIFQTTCAACHGFDGRMMDWGDGDNHNFVGTEAAALPDEVINKILNGHPGVQMLNLRAFPLQDAIDTLSYAATLPTTE